MAEEAGNDEGVSTEALAARLRKAAEEPYAISKDELCALLERAAAQIERLDNVVKAQMLLPRLSGPGGAIY